MSTPHHIARLEAMSDGAQDIILHELCSVLDLPSSHINYDKSFPSLGGNSLSAVKLANQCRKRGVSLLVDCIIRSNSIVEMINSADFVDHAVKSAASNGCVSEKLKYLERYPWDWLQQVEAAGVDFRMDLQSSWRDGSSSSHDQETATERSKSPTITEPSIVEEDQDRMVLLPASELQLSLIHGSIKSPGTNVIQHFETYKPHDVPMVRAAWLKLFQQEVVLSTHYSADLLPQRKTHFNWTEGSTEDEAQFQEWIDAPLVSTDLGSCWKVLSLVRDSRPVKSVVIWTIHHALIDGYSAELLLTKVRIAAAGKPISPGPSSAELMVRLQTMREERRAEGDAFWTEHKDLYSRAATSLLLPPPLETCEEQDEFGECHADLGLNGQSIAATARRCGVTPATIYYSAWALVMTLLTDNDNVVFGIALSGRNLPLPGIEEAIGPFVNTLPLAIATSKTMTLQQLAASMFQRINDLSQYQWTTPDNGFLRNFQSALNMQFDLYLTAADNIIQPIERPYSRQTTDIPLCILIDQDDRARLQYQQASFQREHIELLANLYREAVLSFLRPDMSIGSIQAGLTTPEMQRLVLGYGNVFSQLTHPSSIVDDLVTLFERVVADHPTALAIEKGPTSLTYKELDEQASRVAAALSLHAQPGDIVCVDADRSVEWIVAIFAILKAGAVYCPLDWELPLDLRTLMFKMTSAAIFLSGGADGASRAPQSCSLPLTVESILASCQQVGVPRRDSPQPASTAYVCFTSGSTGTPKGVLCSHEGLVAFQRDIEVRLFAQPGIRVAQVMSPAFDGSIHEIFSALCHGAAIVLPADDNIFQALHGAHSAILTPSVAEVLEPDDYASLQYVYLVGEPVKQSVNDKWAATKTLYNMYGPTEGTCGATIKRLISGQVVAIGKPNPTTRVYILDSKGHLIPPGMVGEIHLAGVQVARGYLGMPDVTAARFLPDHLSRSSSGFMYKTGDRGYWRSNGDIMCLGRNDRQIKLRGFRLDLNDLEIRVAQAVPGLKSVAISPRSDHLVAVVQPKSLDRQMVAAIMAKVLPVYAQPRHIVLVDEFPMTRAGKLDYKEMASDGFIMTLTDKGELRTPLETRLASIWRQILKLGRTVHIGPRSNFLELGGTSLLQVTLLARISSTLRIKVPLKVTIESESLGHLASQLEKLMQQSRGPEGKTKLTLGATGLSAIERDWWARYRLGRNTTTSSFNVSFVADLKPGVVDMRALAQAWNTVLARHSIFRGRYTDHGPIERRYSSQVPRVQRVSRIDLWAEVNRPFDPTRESAIRVSISPNTLAVVMSHIVADLTTLKILLDEVKIVYGGDRLGPVRHTYENSVFLEEDAPLCDLKFWSGYLQDHETLRNRQLSERTGYGGTSRLYQLSSELATSILQFEAVSLQQLAISAVGLSLQPERDDIDIIVGTPFINRSNDAAMETVGLFLEPLPVRVRYAASKDDTTSAPFLRDVRRSANAALGHAVPWHRLLEHLDIGSEYPKQPLFDVMVTFHHQDNSVKLDIPGLQQRLTWAEGAKFSLMTEFTASESGSVILRIEYDDALYSASDIDRLVGRIALSLSMVMSDQPFAATREAVRNGEWTSSLAAVKQNAFGMLVDNL